MILPYSGIIKSSPYSKFYVSIRPWYCKNFEAVILLCFIFFYKMLKTYPYYHQYKVFKKIVDLINSSLNQLVQCNGIMRLSTYQSCVQIVDFDNIFKNICLTWKALLFKLWYVFVMTINFKILKDIFTECLQTFFIFWRIGNCWIKKWKYET